jgi:hypothetical protein
MGDRVKAKVMQPEKVKVMPGHVPSSGDNNDVLSLINPTPKIGEGHKAVTENFLAGAILFPMG